MPNAASHNRNKGQALPEYGLIGGLVAIVSIGALALLGGNISDLIGSVMNSSGKGGTMSNVANAVLKPSNTTAALTGGTTSPGSSGVVLPSAAGGTLTASPMLPTNVTVSSPEFAEFLKNPEKTVTTMGANGTTKILATEMQAFINKLKQDGKITETQAGKLNQLANVIHETAAVEKLLEDRAAQYNVPGVEDGSIFDKNRTTFLETPAFPFEGEQLSAFWLAHNTIGYSETNVPGDSLTKIQQYLDEAKRSGALDDPATASYVGMLTDEVLALGEGVWKSITYTVDEYDESSAFITPETVLANSPGIREGALKLAGSASALTHQDGAGVCNAGNGQDSGTACQ